MDNPHFNINQKVYSVLNGKKGIVQGILYKEKSISYLVNFAPGEEHYCYAGELSTSKVFDNVNGD